MKMKEIVAGASLGASLLSVNACSAEKQVDDNIFTINSTSQPSEAPSHDAESILLSYVADLGQYWHEEVDLPVITFSYVEDDEYKECPHPDPNKTEVIRGDEKYRIVYCNTTNTIIHPEHTSLLYKDFSEKLEVRPSEVAKLILAHEVAHAVQTLTNEESKGSDRERQADCLSGQAIRNVFPDILNEGTDIYRRLGEIGNHDTHGTALQRMIAYTYGAVNEDCFDAEGIPTNMAEYEAK